MAQALNNRGVRKGRRGDTDGAIADYTAAIELPGAPPDHVAITCANLGSCHHEEGRTAEARQWLERALQAGTLPDGGERVKRLLEEMQRGPQDNADDGGHD